ncbi:hypothetical protein MTO96_020296 [Rhipicephalus appendiculatus]
MGEHNKERRRARADALWKTLADKPAAYVDASPIGGDKYAIAAVEGTGRILSTEEITATSILEAEEAAIAMATAIEGTLFIVSDSMSAIRSFRSGQVSETAAKKLQEPAVSIRLLWVPSHEGNPGNEAAHLAARANTNRAEVRLHPTNPEELCKSTRRPDNAAEAAEAPRKSSSGATSRHPCERLTPEPGRSRH